MLQWVTTTNSQESFSHGDSLIARCASLVGLSENETHTTVRLEMVSLGDAAESWLICKHSASPGWTSASTDGNRCRKEME